MRYDDRELPFEIGLMVHAVGLRYKKPYRRNGKMFYRPYRNHFDCARGSREEAAFEALRGQDMAVRSEADRMGGHMYFMTRKGLDWLGDQLGITIQDIDRRRGRKDDE